MGYLDRMQVQMATARKFLLILRLGRQKEQETFSYLNRIEKMLVEQGFKAKHADKERFMLQHCQDTDIKGCLIGRKQ